MDLPYDVAVNVGSGALGAGLGASWVRARNRYRYRSTAAFWSFLEKPTVFVVGELESSVLLNTLHDALAQLAPDEDRAKLTRKIIDHVRRQEFSGLIGRGDYDAVVNLVIRLNSLRIPVRPIIVHPSELGDRKTQNLVLIGGRDVNPLTAAYAPRLGCRLEATINTQGRNMIRDTRLDVEHPVREIRQPGEDGTVQVDYGMFARSANPDNRDSEIIIFAGAHGLGTLAAMEVTLREPDQKRLRHDVLEYDGSMEGLVRHERMRGGHGDGQTNISLEFTRRLNPRG